MKSINKNGFTLIELIFVIIILVILSSVFVDDDSVKQKDVSIETKTTIVPQQNGTTRWG